MKFSFSFFYRFQKKGIITLWPFDGGGGGTKRPFRGFYPSFVKFFELHKNVIFLNLGINAFGGMFVRVSSSPSNVLQIQRRQDTV